MKDRNVLPIGLIKGLCTKAIIVLAIILVLVISALKLYTIEEVRKYASLEEFTAYLDERVPALMKHYGIPGVNIALVVAAGMTSFPSANFETGTRDYFRQTPVCAAI